MSSVIKEICSARKEAGKLVSSAKTEAGKLIEQAHSMADEQIKTAEKEANEKMRNDLLKVEEDCRQIEKAIIREYETESFKRIEEAKESVEKIISYLVEKAKDI